LRPPWEFEKPLCAEVGSDIFFPEKEEGKVYAGMAKKICANCIHKIECLEWAVVANEKFGIWGGVTERNRRVLRKRRGFKESA
jgi:WhiB family redox-sensing transcriptional regulator